MIKIDKEFVKDVLNFVKEMGAENDYEGKETYIHRGLRIALETGKYNGWEHQEKTGGFACENGGIQRN